MRLLRRLRPGRHRQTCCTGELTCLRWGLGLSWALGLEGGSHQRRAEAKKEEEADLESQVGRWPKDTIEEETGQQGADLGVAIRGSIQVMAKPLLASTGTTVAAFIPLLLAKGGVGDFTRAIPTMVVIAMIVSYVLSIFVLPLIAFYWLKQRSKKQGIAFDLTDSIARRSSALVTRNPVRVLLLVGLLDCTTI